MSHWREQYAKDMIGNSPAILSVLQTMRRVADTSSTVLITGESGTGKELVARALHRGRSDGPFVAINCSALAKDLVEAELFGHTKGAFTGAVAQRQGLIVSAHGGTLFLDEIGDMPMHMQSLLLRVLEERRVTPVGADHSIPVDIRLVAATHCDLLKMVSNGTFRADLFYRIDVINLHLPPLRERTVDIPDLVHHFCGTQCIDSQAMERLIAHPWPGNIRELRSTLERSLAMKEGLLMARDLLFRRGFRQAPKELNLKTALDATRKECIEEALAVTGGNATEASQLLGINRTTLVETRRRDCKTIKSKRYVNAAS